jgi:Thioredoxin like C-terminal domain
MQDAAHVYEIRAPGLNEWGLLDDRTIGSESAALDAPGGGIAFRFQARDLHLVLGRGSNDQPVRFKVTICGTPPGEAHGADIDAGGNSSVTDQRLCQLVRQVGAVGGHTFDIRFLDAGARASAFTFG